MANGVRQICLLLIPSAVLMAVLAEPITRLVYQRGAFGARGHRPGVRGDGLVVDLAALPGREPAVLAHLLQPAAAVGHDGAGRRSTWWSTPALAAALYGPFGIAGIVIGTVVGHGRDVRGAGLCCCAATSAGSRGGARSAAALRDARRGGAAGGACPTASGTGSTSLLGRGRSSRRPWPCSRRSPPAWPSTRRRCGRCGCPRRARSGGCC